MAVRQYIGARYVPKFMGAWSNTTVYEPLSIVTYNNSSYTSKKSVPAGVNPTDTSYWALTGNYNGQISHLQDEIDNLDSSKMSLVKDRFYLFLGDSYDSDRSISEYGWITPLCVYSGITNYIKKSQGSYGFVGYIAGYTWLSKCQELTASEREAITDVFIGGCAADWNASVADIEQAMDTLNSWFYNNLPNLKTISLAFLEYNYSDDVSRVSSQFEHLHAIKTKAHRLGWFFVAGAETIIADPRCHENANDWLHPNETGVYRIAYYLVDALYFSHINVEENYTMNLSVDSTSANHVFAALADKTMYCSINQGTLTFELTQSMNLVIENSFGSQAAVSFANSSKDVPIVKVRFTVPCYVLSGSNIIPAYAEIRFDTRSHCTIAIAASSNDLIATNHVIIPRFTVTWNLNTIGTN